MTFPTLIKPGLARINAAMAAFGDPHLRLRTVHIAGTNGKGSTAKIIQSAVTAAGYRCGLFTSPAAGSICDTILIDIKSILAAEYQALENEVTAATSGFADPLSPFEITTAAALLWFSREAPDLCVIECGLGGGGDATNCLPPPLVAVLTPISLDHTAWLGNTIEDIAREKCGILKSPCEVAVSPAMPAKAIAMIRKRAAELGLTVSQPDRTAAALLEENWRGSRFTYGGREYRLKMPGGFQLDNALTAITVLQLLGRKGLRISSEHIAAGIETAVLPCRMEAVAEDPLTIFDGAHNPAGAAALADTVRRLSPGIKPVILLGMLRDKDIVACAEIFIRFAGRIVCVTPPVERGMPAEELVSFFPDRQAVAAASPEQGLILARSSAGREGLVVVCGSLFLTGYLRTKI
ncbi:MAG: bifunctional folylpolyglutamate synthase/dihydrofolate synthase [Oscillospiraceae bacterium]|nr:bifunctional folylpolyglutamate synthase/dihydrofolate synthase [Oscillospiraceae bacterium]